MAIETGIDYQQLWDGSRRWLWQVRYCDRTWRAGVEHRYDDARHAAFRAWDALRGNLKEDERSQLPCAEEAVICDLDRVERGEEGAGTLIV